jgi:hypothetical protein
MHNKRLIPVKDSKGLFRDEETGAILNKNDIEYSAYIENRKKLLSDKERIDNLENQLTDVRSDLNDIKDLLLKALKDT